MEFAARALSEEMLAELHAESLRLLAEVGVRFHGEKALGILEAHGAQVSREDHQARIPAELVEEALRTAPKTIVYEARNPSLSFRMPSPWTGLGMDGTAAFALDFQTGERRYGTKKDIENAMRVFQAMDLAVMAWAPTCASDAPAPSRPLHEFLDVLRYCSKHGEHELHRVDQVPYLVEALTAIQGSEDAIRRNKIASLIYCPVAPLVHDGQMLDAYLELGQLDLPVMIMPMPVAGTTGPASLYSNTLLANTEALSALVVFQLAHPGRPMVYSNAVGVVDFTTGNFLAGSSETALQSAALISMGRYYHLPTTSTGCSCDAKEPGPQAILEKTISALLDYLAGSDMIIGIGEVDCSQLLVLEQLVVDNEIAHRCQRVREGIDTRDEKRLLADIGQVGPGGHFLKSRSTRQAARSGEFIMPGLVDRHPYEAWVERGRPSIYTAARSRVQEILEGPVVDPLPDDVIGKLEDILRRADAELKED
jgi:trimethylamine--corrinoid protein Co-methyltransferase